MPHYIHASYSTTEPAGHPTPTSATAAATIVDVAGGGFTAAAPPPPPAECEVPHRTRRDAPPHAMEPAGYAADGLMP